MSVDKTNELLDRVTEIVAEHGHLTGQEFLDLTGDHELLCAYQKYWEAIVVPDLMDAIDKRIEEVRSE